MAKIVYISLAILAYFVFLVRVFPVKATTLTVCANGCAYTTIQAAVDAAAIGDTILVRNGSYSGFTVSKSVTVVGENIDVNDPRNNGATINGQVIATGNFNFDQGPKVKGFRVIAGLDPVIIQNSAMTIEESFIKGTGGDGVSINTGGGVIRGNRIESGGDDGIDVDKQTKDVIIDSNYILASGQDGIEIRQQDATIVERVTMWVSDNRIETSNQDGIQIMDYNNFSHRKYVLEKNLFLNNKKAAIGLNVGTDTHQIYTAAPMPEPLYAVNNTFIGNDAAISGGANLVAINNIFSGQKTFDLKNVTAQSVIKYNLFSTSPKLVGSNNLDSATTIVANPLLDTNYFLSLASPAIDKGTAAYQHAYSYDGSGGGSAQTYNEFVINLNSSQYKGTAPDLGWKESDQTVTKTPTPINTPTGNLTPTTPPPTIPNCPKDRGDANCDGNIDQADYDVWKAEYSKRSSTQTADFDANGTVDLVDFEIWRRNHYVGIVETPTPTPTNGGPTPSKTPTPINPTATQTPIPTISNSLVEIVYQPINEDFANPERGFMRQSNISVDQPLDPSKIGKVLPADTVDWVYFHLENYRDPRDGKGVNLSNYQGRPLEPLGSGVGLDTVNNAFKEARNKGLKLVIRFLYVGYPGIGSTQDPNQTEPDAPLSLVQQHLNQLAPVLAQNKDALVAVQFGFVGYWGEWHSSKYLGSLQNRKAVMDAVLAATPNDRMVQLRYPRYKQLFYGGPLTDADAFNQSDVARVAIHDDAFLKDDTDDGTFKSTTGGTKITNYCDGFSGGEIACWRDFVNKDARFEPVGGEAGTHSNPPSPLANCPNALNQLNNLHFSFLHNGYAKVVLDTWVNQGCMPEIRQRLGYRFVLNRLIVSNQVAPGGSLDFHLELENKGFASPFNPRPAILILKGNNTSYQKEITLPSVDPRGWFPGQIINIDTVVQIPSDIPQGTYNLYLWLPDASSNLSARPQYAIRLANQNVWQANTGFNLLYDSLLITTQ